MLSLIEADRQLVDINLGRDRERHHELAGGVRRGQHAQPVHPHGGRTLYRLTEPMLRPIRRLLPNLGGVDISPIILLLGLFFLQSLLH